MYNHCTYFFPQCLRRALEFLLGFRIIPKAHYFSRSHFFPECFTFAYWYVFRNWPTCTGMLKSLHSDHSVSFVASIPYCIIKAISRHFITLENYCICFANIQENLRAMKRKRNCWCKISGIILMIWWQDIQHTRLAYPKKLTIMDFIVNFCGARLSGVIVDNSY